MRLIIIAMLIAGIATAPWTASAQEPERVSKAQFDTWMKEISNWGRWGDDDELGTLNLITKEKRLAAAKLVKDCLLYTSDAADE